MENQEPIKITKAFKGIVEPKNYIKAGVFSVNIGIMIVFVLGIVFIFNHFFGKNEQTQSTGITVEKGASVESIVIENKQNQDNKTVSLEFSASSQDATIMFKKYINEKWHVGVGGQWDYEADVNEVPVKPVVRLGVDF